MARTSDPAKLRESKFYVRDAKIAVASIERTMNRIFGNELQRVPVSGDTPTNAYDALTLAWEALRQVAEGDEDG
jgi:hypothetical protein